MRTKLVYISGGDNFAPAEIKRALDEIRQTLGLSDDIVLFGLPVDGLAEAEPKPAVQDHKVLQFPSIKRKSILNVIEKPAPRLEEKEAAISDARLVVNDTPDGDDDSITKLFEGLPSMTEEAPPAEAKGLGEEFEEYLDKEDGPKPAKKVKPFGRKGKGAFNNVLGDLFSFAGIAANDDGEDFTLPDFIKRP
ncbi:MAG: hypothetical protein LBL21_04850 [Rickettsiales bacterium]|jgi:hypothetical protein|nr:hypothetical protein [Rickettsiales bacterium]